jgi:hypothetical protein
VWLNQQSIADWFRLYGYQPTAEVADLVDAGSFNERAIHLFYINRPEIVAKKDFGKQCSSKQEQTIVLGCYKSVQSGIYVLKITDDARLDGVMEVTAAHEMLHAAYDRLSADERQQVDGWLNDYYRNQLDDERIKQTIESYKKSEPDALENEMHSIFGTEVSDLPPPLEGYYRRYFNDRSQVVRLAETYQAEFTSRKQLVARYDQQLVTLKQLIDQQEDNLRKQLTSLEQESARLQSLRRSNVDAYNAGVGPYNTSIQRYNQLVEALKAQISQYNALVKKRNAVALEQVQLTKELSGDEINEISN